MVTTYFALLSLLHPKLQPTHEAEEGPPATAPFHADHLFIQVPSPSPSPTDTRMLCSRSIAFHSNRPHRARP